MENLYQITNADSTSGKHTSSSPDRQGIIESNGQIVRNEAGTANHKPYLGSYKERELKECSDVITRTSQGKSWLSVFVFTSVIILAIAEIIMFVV